MIWRLVGVWGLISMTSGQARAQAVPQAPAPAPETVVEEQQSIRVGDVIMAPRIETEEAEPVRAQPTAEPERRHWYGAPILIADGLAYGSIALAFNVEATAGVALPLGVGTFVLGGPIVHATHGRWGRMGLSLAARTALPIIGLTAGVSTCATESDCSSAVLGFTLLGMAAASIIDATALPYEPSVPPAPARATVQPALSLDRDRLFLGASGTF